MSATDFDFWFTMVIVRQRSKIRLAEAHNLIFSASAATRRRLGWRSVAAWENEPGPVAQSTIPLITAPYCRCRH
jgi:hypothetical protein